MSESTALNPHQKRAVMAALRVLEEALDQIDWLVVEQRNVVTVETLAALGDHERSALRGGVAAIRQEIARIVRQFALPALTQIDRRLVAGLRGYGALDRETARELDGALDRLVALTQNMLALVQQDVG